MKKIDNNNIEEKKKLILILKKSKKYIFLYVNNLINYLIKFTLFKNQ